MTMLIDDPPNLFPSPGNILSALFPPSGDLALPEFALVITMEREGGRDFLQCFWAFGFSHEDCGWDQNEMTCWVDDHINVNPFEIRLRLQAIPKPYSFADGLVSTRGLNSVMADLALNHPALFPQLVVATDCH